jgi:hypothetical protein
MIIGKHTTWEEEEEDKYERNRKIKNERFKENNMGGEM